LRLQGKQRAAIESYGRAIEADARLHQAHTNLGNILQSIGEWTAADACYENALTLRPDSAEAHSNWGNLRRAEGRLEEAVVQYRLALVCNPDFADAYTNLGTVLNQQGKLEESTACHEKALALRPDFAEAHHNLACVLHAKGLTDNAFGRYNRAIALKPDYANAHFGQALILLLQARYVEGWQGYEWRWKSDQQSTQWRQVDEPLWTGERLESGHLLLWGEQGIGDEILFAGLIHEAVATGCECVLECDPRLVPLFARSFPGVKVTAPHSGDYPPIAAHLPTGSLPALFRNTNSDFPSNCGSYLNADPIGSARFRDLYSDGRRVVGLAWHTKNAKSGYRRSLELSQLALLFTRIDVRWISLQYGDHDDIEAETAKVGAPMLIDRSVNQFVNIDTFAAQVSAMDLVITIDNSTAHLAGALGVPVWVLLPFSPDWRWLKDREDCPWYPSMRLFRQPSLADWGSVVTQVDRQLDEINHAGSMAPSAFYEQALQQQASAVSN
jgi:Tfp pilus assembly protein PilF